MIRIETIPLRLIVPELATAKRGVSVEIEIVSTDLLNLNAGVRLIQMHEQQSSEYAPDFNSQEVDAEEETIPQVELDTPSSDTPSDSIIETQTSVNEEVTNQSVTPTL
jgi:exoribonuclease-2